MPLLMLEIEQIIMEKSHMGIDVRNSKFMQDE